MDNKFSRLFDNWPVCAQTMAELYERFGVLLKDLGLEKSEIRIIAFISSVWRGEMKYYDSRGTSSSWQRYLDTNDKRLAEEQLTGLFGVDREHSIFTFDNSAEQVNVYDEFGMIDQDHGEIRTYGVIIQCHQLKFSKILFELLSQFSFYCKNILDNEGLEIEDYMLENLVHVALKKQIDIDLYNILASMSYEKKVPSGGILLVDGARERDLRISFREKHPFDINNAKQIRKLLEMTTENLFLVSQGGHIIGLGDYGNPGDWAGDFELLLFNGHQRWSYYQGGRELLSYREGKYTFIFDKTVNFISYFPPNFISESNYAGLNGVLHRMMQLKYGILLIISDEAQAEVERLCGLGRGYAIKQIDLKRPDGLALLPSITSIDGAIFVDTDLICYGAGLILDGIAVKAGLSSRGARYNSAQCYIDNKDHEKYAAVIVSDDETIDIIYNKKEI